MTRSEQSMNSWIESANASNSDFPLLNLPYCLFRRTGSGESPRLGVGIGDQILELKKCAEEGFLDDLDDAALDALCKPAFNDLLSLGHEAWSLTRKCLITLLHADTPALRDSNRWRKRMFIEMDRAELVCPTSIGDYTDFYASEHHATNVGSMFRPDKPLMPNWKNLPVGYHGRASSIVMSGTPIRRPCGQTCAKDDGPTEFGPSKSLDYEFEMGFLIGPGNALGERITVDDAKNHIFGMVIVNDWSARDIQRWEYQPLGPFNAKNFATTISPWIVTLEALEPYFVGPPKRAKSDPKLLDYLVAGDDFLIDIDLVASISSATMREKGIPPFVVSEANFKDLYWTMSQMVAHHTSTGCNLRPMDLLATGTISGKAEASRGCLLERTWRGENPIELPDGTKRKFLEDGDEVILRASCSKKGAPRISFGECRGVITPAVL